MTGWPLGHAFVVAEGAPDRLDATLIWHPEGPDRFEPLRDATARIRFSTGVGMPGRILASGEPEWVTRADIDPGFVRAAVLAALGMRSAFGLPVKIGRQVMAVLEFFGEQPAPPDADLLLTVRTVGEQIGRVLERRLADDRLRQEKAALEREVAERRRIEQHQQLLLGELDHRVKNTLTVVMGLAAQTARASRSLDEFNQSFGDRLSALSRAHSLLTARHWESTPLAALAAAILAPHVAADDPRVTAVGPEILLGPKAALAVSLILHELVTNAAKHGALATPDGRTRLEWTLDGSEDGTRATIHWRESGVPGTRPPTRRGFGSKLIEASVRMELGGTSSADWREDGLRQMIAFPLNPGAGA